MDALTWISRNAEHAGIITYLSVTLFLAVVGLYKQWWVPGWMFRDCIDREKKLRETVDERAHKAEVRLELLEEIHTSRPPTRRRKEQGE